MCSSARLTMTIQTFIRWWIFFNFKFNRPTITLSQYILLFLFIYYWISLFNRFLLKQHLYIIVKINNLFIFHNKQQQMGAACQKQFQNISNQLTVDYQRQKQRISINSIKLQHKNFRPNSKNISIGMIDTILHTQNSQYNNNNQYNMKNGIQRSKIMNYSKSSLNASNIYQNYRINTVIGKQLDREQLHATIRPFQGAQTVIINSNQQQIPIQHKKKRQALDLNFYFSLALPQYDYHDYPEAVKKQYQNLYVCEQQDRNGVKYIGQWKDNKTIHGNGVMQSNTTKYIGQFRNGLKHFHGREIEKQEVYEGQFVDNRRKGKGIKYTPQSIQQGQFDQQLINGKIIYSNGNQYQGKLLHNKYHEKGIFTNTHTNTIRQGQYKNGKLNGLGRIKINNNLTYQGQFYQDMKHGKGIYYWNDNQYYNGTYCKDKKHGNGMLVKDNTKYKGNFNNGHFDGKIQVYTKNNKGEQIMKIYNYKNGMRIYQDQSQQSMVSDTYGLPDTWQDIVVRKNQQQSKIKQEDIYIGYKIPILKFNSTSNFSSFNCSKNQSDPNDLSSMTKSDNIIKSNQNDKKPIPSVIAEQPRLLSQSKIMSPSIIKIPDKNNMESYNTSSLYRHNNQNKSSISQNSFNQVNRSNQINLRLF